MDLCHVSLIGKAPVLKTGVAIKSIMRSSRMRGALGSTLRVSLNGLKVSSQLLG